jgi:hypothetical protein
MDVLMTVFAFGVRRDPFGVFLRKGTWKMKRFWAMRFPIRQFPGRRVST